MNTPADRNVKTMWLNLKLIFLCLMVGSMSYASSKTAELKVAPLFSDHMVLQAEKTIPIWGYGSFGKMVEVKMNGQTIHAKVSINGMWQAKLTAMHYGGPFSLSIECENERICFNDVMVGEVWLASGQSNMDFKISQAKYPQDTLRALASFPLIRQLNVPRCAKTNPTDDPPPNIKWQKCDATTIGEFSAVAYFFAQHLHEKLGVAVGIISSTWSGTAAESWLHPQELVNYPDKSLIRRYRINMHSNLNDKPQTNPSVLFNGMIYPLHKLPIKGVIWYQGENNASVFQQYARVQKLLIKGFRLNWNNSSLPFYFVQLPNIAGFKTWPWMREAQSRALGLSNTGMAVTADLGDPGNIHPRNKEQVGRRLALQALSKTYGKQIVSDGPHLKKIQIRADTILLSFNEKNNIVLKSSQGFQISDKNGNYKDAIATIEDNRIHLIAPGIKHPLNVRYAWKDNPVLSIYNNAGLPAAPFRTDNFKYE